MSFIVEYDEKIELTDLLDLLAVFERVRQACKFGFSGTNEEFDDLKVKLSENGIDVIEEYVRRYPLNFTRFERNIYAVRRNRLDIKDKIHQLKFKFSNKSFPPPNNPNYSEEREREHVRLDGEILEYNDCCIKDFLKTTLERKDFKERKNKEMYPLKPEFYDQYDEIKKRFPLIPMKVCPSCIDYAENLQRQYEKIVEKYGLERRLDEFMRIIRRIGK
jgi:hypothetical protein